MTPAPWGNALGAFLGVPCPRTPFQSNRAETVRKAA
jgi:hypothetical protein